MAQQKSKTNGLVYVEMLGDACVRIFANVKAAVLHPQPLITMENAAAVESIRRQVFLKFNMTCCHCGAGPLPWDGPGKGEMHEREWRGRGGEISLSNSVLLCYDCHHNTDAGHGNRKPQWSAK